MDVDGAPSGSSQEMLNVDDALPEGARDPTEAESRHGEDLVSNPVPDTPSRKLKMESSSTDEPQMKKRRVHGEGDDHDSDDHDDKDSVHAEEDHGTQLPAEKGDGAMQEGAGDISTGILASRTHGKEIQAIEAVENECRALAEAGDFEAAAALQARSATRIPAKADDLFSTPEKVAPAPILKSSATVVALQAQCVALAKSCDYAGAAALESTIKQMIAGKDPPTRLLEAQCKAFADAGNYTAAAALKAQIAAEKPVLSEKEVAHNALQERCMELANAGDYAGAAALKASMDQAPAEKALADAGDYAGAAALKAKRLAGAGAGAGASAPSASSSAEVILKARCKALAEAGDYHAAAALQAQLAATVPAKITYTSPDSLETQCKELADARDYAGAASLKAQIAAETSIRAAPAASEKDADDDALQARCVELADACDYAGAAALKATMLKTPVGKNTPIQTLESRCKELAEAGNYEDAAALKAQLATTAPHSPAGSSTDTLEARCRELANAGDYAGAAALKAQACI